MAHGKVQGKEGRLNGAYSVNVTCGSRGAEGIAEWTEFCMVEIPRRSNGHTSPSGEFIDITKQNNRNEVVQ